MGNLTNIYAPVTKNWSVTGTAISVMVTLIMNLTALFFNLLILLSIVLTKRLRQEAESILVGNLALSDLLVACCIMPFTADVLIKGKLGHGSIFWTFIGFSNFFFCIASILNLVALSFDQLVTIKCPFRYTANRKRSAAILMALLVWVYSGLCALPPLLGISSYACFIPNTGACSTQQWSGTNDAVIFTVLVTVLTWGVGIIVLVFSNVQIYSIIRKQRKAIQTTMVHKSGCPILIPSNPSNISTHYARNLSYSVNWKEKKVSRFIERVLRSNTGVEPEENYSSSAQGLEPGQKLPRRCKCIPSTKQATSLLIIVVCYFISWTPFCLVLLIEIVLKQKKYNELSLIFLWIGHLSSCFNPILYFYRFRKFRDPARHFVRNILRK
ncbi:5-hydroxytryptamine receptor 1D-like isoform X1 [Rhopilema esculentum]|uniref:5-hydroxytryptamine receptor 1D-like isoform X1 n=1 Tax=Rhopilema esculentum TaxID=499914 RepID=UPI0031D14D38